MTSGGFGEPDEVVGGAVKVSLLMTKFPGRSRICRYCIAIVGVTG